MPEDNTIELKLGMSDEAISVQQTIAEQLKENARVMRERFKSGEQLDKVQQLGVVVQAEVSEDDDE